MQKPTQQITYELLFNEIAGLRKKLKSLSLKEGPEGPEGAQGQAGAKGETGLQGVKGDHGLPGKDGERGTDGQRGPQGIAGVRGEVGPVGKAGPQGVQGPKGDKGDQGLKGDKGEQGPKGDNGQDGVNGSSVERVTVKDNKLFVKIEGKRLKEVGKLPTLLTATGGGGRGPKGDSGTRQINTNVGILVTQVVDEVDSSIIDSVKWLVTLVDSVNGLKSAAEIFAMSSGASCKYNVYGRMLKDVPVSFDVQLNMGSLQLFVTNNHSAEIVAKVVRIQTTA